MEANTVQLRLNGRSDVSLIDRFQQFQALVVHLPSEEQFRICIYIQLEPSD